MRLAVLALAGLGLVGCATAQPKPVRPAGGPTFAEALAADAEARRRLLADMARIQAESRRAAETTRQTAVAERPAKEAAFNKAVEAYSVCVRASAEHYAVASSEPADTIARVALQTCKGLLLQARDLACAFRGCSQTVAVFESNFAPAAAGWVMDKRAEKPASAPASTPEVRT